MKILEKLQSISLFGKLKDFSFYEFVLRKREKFFKKELGMNNELILYHNDRIKNYKNIILDSEKRIEELIRENIKINTNIYNIIKAKEV